MQVFNQTMGQDVARAFKTKGENFVGASEIIQPVVEIKRQCDVIRRVNSINATGVNMYTTPADRDFYITAASISLVKDVTATSTSTYIQFQDENNQSREILHMIGISVTPQQSTSSIAFTYPIRCFRNTVITINNSTNVGNVSSSGTIYGYTTD